MTSNATARSVPERKTLAARLRQFFSRLFFWLAALTLMVLLLSRLATDRWLVSQFVFWVPLWVYLVFVVVFLCIERLTAKRAAARWKSPSWWMLMTCVLLTAALAFNAIPSKPTATPPEALRIVHWNMSSPDMLSFQGTLADFPACKSADIILLGVTVPQSQLQRMVQSLGDDWKVRRLGVFAIASRYEIIGSTQHALGLQSNSPRGPESAFQKFYNEQLADRFGVSRREFNLPDPGYIVEARIQCPEREMVIHLIDLPSNPFRSRMQIASSAATSINSLKKTGVISTDPDVLIGDFNIPVGSASLRLLSGALAHAIFLSESGDSAPTWPRAFPLLRIDHAFVKESFRVLNYRTFDAGISDHRAQVLTVLGPSAPPSLGQ